MKHIVPKAVKLTDQEILIDVPDDFEWKLLDKMITDLGFIKQPEGSETFDGYADIDLSSVLKAIRKRDPSSLLAACAKLSPRSIVESYGDRMDLFYALTQVGALLKKYPSPGVNACEQALKTFLKYETACRRYNTENVKALIAVNRSHPDFLGIIEEIRTDISRLLGENPNVQRVYDCAKHGPGTAAGFQEMGNQVTPYFKWSTIPYTVSSGALDYAKDAILSYPQWIGALLNDYRIKNDIPMWAPISMDAFWEATFDLVDYCRYSSVPKTALTERSIAIEPTLNVYLQLGVDRLIRSRLRRRWKIDLNTQQLNRNLAQESSVTNENVTIDLQGASEMVTRALCLIFLPAGWYSLLDDLRSKSIMLPESKSPVPLAKMSAMGNGFTFALESLIFAALSRCAMRRKQVKGSLAIFGDDIILPRTAAAFLIDLLNLCGFTVNEEKSFLDGPFRESCGMDCIRGHDVRPFFLKKKVTTVMDVFYIHNSLLVVQEKLPWQWCVNFRLTLRWLRRYIPKKFSVCYGPPSESLDTYLFSDRRLLRFGDEKYQMVVNSTPIEFSDRGSDFFFRKLMVNYHGSPRDRFGFTVSTGGSAYDITMRDTVRYSLTARRVW